MNFADIEFKFRGDGNAYADGSFNGSGADYQEYFESTDGTALEIGRTVVLEGDKVRAYNSDTDDTNLIMGVVRPKGDNKNSGIVGNTAENHWTGQFLTDDYGRYLMQDYTKWNWDEIKYTESDVLPDGKEVGDVKREQGSVYEWRELEKDANWTPPEDATKKVDSERARNPEWDKTQTYVMREERDEWNVIGLLGQIQIKAGETTRPGWIKMKNISDAVELWLVR